MVTDNQISIFLFPYLSKGPTSNDPRVAPNGTSPFTIELLLISLIENKFNKGLGKDMEHLIN